MGPFAAILLATPLFGFALSPPELPAQPDSFEVTPAASGLRALSRIRPSGLFLLAPDRDEADDSEQPGKKSKKRHGKPKKKSKKRASQADKKKRGKRAQGGSSGKGRKKAAGEDRAAPDRPVKRSAAGGGDESAAEVEPGPPRKARGADAERDAYRLQLGRRAKVAGFHRTMALLTWGAMSLTLASGIVQFRNLYGAWAPLHKTPCVQGNTWPDQSRCSGVPVAHLVTSVSTAALYTATMGFAIAMPDPDRASEGNSKVAKRLRAHKILRWVHLGGMIAQAALGPLVANAHLMGLDRLNDYGTMRALGSVHLAAGIVTWAALATAGYLMLF